MTLAQDTILQWADDYDLFAQECVSFRGKEGMTIRHDRPHPGQLKLRLNRHKRKLKIALKARQVGSSSEIAAQFVHQALFNPGHSIGVVAQTMRGVKGISALYAFIIKNLPRILRRGIFKAEINVFSITWPKLGSSIEFDTANSDSFRGVPRQGVHLTECAFFQDLRATLEVLRPTCHGPIVAESTANGPGTFHQLCNDPHVDQVFISWLDDSTCVSDEPLPDDITEKELAYIERVKAEPAQARWFVQRVREIGWESFRQEHPSTPEEAFILSGARFFRVAFFPPSTAAIPSLVIYRKPKRGNRYVLGADPASGSITGDRSAAVLLDVTNPDNILTAAVYADRVTTSEFAKVLDKISRAYFGVITVVERNAGWGLAVIDSLRKLKVPLYRSKSLDKRNGKITEQYGWNTTANSRKLILSALQEVINEHVWKPDDPRIEEECNAFRYDDEGKPQAADGCHDDLVLAAALAVQGIQQSRSSKLEESKSIPVPSRDASFEEWARYERQSGVLQEEIYAGEDE